MKKVGGVEKAAKVLFFGRLLDINVREHYETNERDIYRAKAYWAVLPENKAKTLESKRFGKETEKAHENKQQNTKKVLIW